MRRKASVSLVGFSLALGHLPVGLRPVGSWLRGISLSQKQTGIIKADLRRCRRPGDRSAVFTRRPGGQLFKSIETTSQGRAGGELEISWIPNLRGQGRDRGPGRDRSLLEAMPRWPCIKQGNPLPRTLPGPVPMTWTKEPDGLRRWRTPGVWRAAMLETASPN